MPEVELPAGGWRPRPHQMKMWRYMDGGGKRAFMFGHRRWGKDEILLRRASIAVFERPATYWHMLPQKDQARRAVWEAINPHTGVRRIDETFPKALRRRTIDNAMMIEFKNGAVWQVLGSDNYDALVGAPPAGVTFSEYALADPRAWAFVRPILRENGGWAAFITTPRGRNHAVKVFEAFRDDPDAFADISPADQTGVFSQADLEAELRDYIKEWGEDLGKSFFQQEYLCDFDAPVLGAYYAKYLNAIEREGHLLENIHDPGYPVETWWDLGIQDATVIWFVQVIGGTFRFIDYWEANDVGLEVHCDAVRAKPYKYSRHIPPHDIEARELGTGLTRLELMRKMLGEGGRMGRIEVSPLQKVDDGIAAVRSILPQCYFERAKCARGLDALRQYQREWDEERKTFKLKPLHDWSSHAADAMRTGAMMWRPLLSLRPPEGNGRRDRWKLPGKVSSVGWAAR